MKKMYREFRRMVEGEGGHVVSFTQGKKHIKVTIKFEDGAVIVQSIASSPSDGNWLDKNRQYLNQLRRNHYANH